MQDVGRTLEKLLQAFTSFSHVLPTSQVGYHVSKPIESAIYCFHEITLSMSLLAQYTIGF